jgi:hypothetical protein
MTDSGPQKPKDPGFTELFADAASKSGIGRGIASDSSTGQSVLVAIGGVRGILEAVLPSLAFIIIFGLTQQLVISLIAPIAIGVIFTIVRLVQKSSVTQAVGGLAAIVLSAALALFTGRGQDFFLTGIWVNAIYGGVMALSVIVGWPIIGLIVGFLEGDGVAWRQHRRTFRVMQGLTLLWVGLFALRLAIELPLYYSDNVAGLGIAKIVLGIPLYAPVLVLTWFIARAAYARRRAEESDTAVAES